MLHYCTVKTIKCRTKACVFNSPWPREEECFTRCHVRSEKLTTCERGTQEYAVRAIEGNGRVVGCSGMSGQRC